MRRIGALAALTFAALVGLAGVGVLLWGGYLGAITDESGNTPFDAPATVVCLVGLLIMGCAFGLVDLLRRFSEGREYDPVDDFLIVAIVVWFGALAAGVVIATILIL